MAEVIEEFYVVARNKVDGDYFSFNSGYPSTWELDEASQRTTKDDLKEVISSHWDNNFNNPDDYDFLSVRSIIVMEKI